MKQKNNRPAGSLRPSGHAEVAYNTIRRDILTAVLAPGTQLSRRALAARLGLGVVAVGTALQRLEYEGFVESVPRFGTRVKLPSLDEVRDNYVVREALETQSARLFAEKASPREIEEMRTLAAEVDARQADPRVTFFEYFVANERFHRRLAECTGCQGLVRAIQGSNTLNLAWQVAAITKFRGSRANSHQELMTELERRDVEAADRAMREHVRRGTDVVLMRLEAYATGDGGFWTPE